MPEKAKTKTNLQQCISLHIILPQIVPLQNDTKALNVMFPATQNDKAKNARKSHKKPATVHFTNYYPSTNYTFTKRHTSIKYYVPSYSKWLRQKCQKKAKNKTNLQQYISLQFTFPQIIPLQNDTQALNIMFPAAQNDEAKNAKKPKQNKLATVKIV